MTMNLEPNYYLQRYKILLNRRKNTFDLLLDDDIQPEWLIKRPSTHQWSIEEILRHMMGNEIRYLQMPLDNNIKQHELAVKAQWVDNIFFRYEKNEPVGLETLILVFDKLAKISTNLLENVTPKILDENEKAPWGEILLKRDLITNLFDHNQFHRGQIHLLLTYFRGPPKYRDPPFGTKFG